MQASTYVIIGLIVIIIILAAQLFLLKGGIRDAAEQMDEIEEHPERNRQLKALTSNHDLQELLKRINYIYQARQKERIVYQRRETQIRQEIENISHDLRTPLTSIMGYVDLISDGETSKEEREEFLKIISKRARVLQGFIQDFYEISRIEADDYPMLPEALPVQSIIRETIVAYYHEFNRKNIQVSVELEDKNSIILADKILFNRIINNLIQNALKYAVSKFSVRQFVTEKRCILQFINDRGEMTDQELSLIFNRFYTGDASRSNSGTGLGLTITKLLVEKMKGSIDARFEDDLFIIELQWTIY